MAVLFALGFASGLPLYLTGQTLQAWLSDAGVPLPEIAAMSSVGLAYTFKFAWAPLLDRFQLPVLGRRRGWVLAFQIALVVAIGGMGLVDPVAQPALLSIVAVVVVVLSASLDVVLDAYNTDLLAPEERAAGASVYVLGYRVAIVVTGTIALMMADVVPWSVVYATMAVLMAVGIVATLLAEEPAAPALPPASLAAAITRPFIELWRRLGPVTLGVVLAFTVIYKFGDSFAQSLLLAFLHRGAGFELSQIAAVNQVFGLAGILLGGLAAGSLVARFGLRRMLVAFGVLQAATNLLYAVLAVTGKSFVVFGAAVLFDNLANTMGTAAFVAVLMSVCTSAVSATQFALLTSLSSVGQRVFGPLASDVVAAVDWSGFFAVTSVMALPGLALAGWVVRRIESGAPRDQKLARHRRDP